MRPFDNDIIITVGKQWNHAQEQFDIGRSFSGGSDAHNAVAARRLSAMSEQSASSAEAVVAEPRSRQRVAAKPSTKTSLNIGHQLN